MGDVMSKELQTRCQHQSRFTDEFLYFFLRARKNRVRKVVERLLGQYPESPRNNRRVAS
jgi:hypothetical protein